MLFEYMMYRRAQQAEAMAEAALTQAAPPPAPSNAARQMRMKHNRLMGWALMLSFGVWMIWGGAPPS